MTVPVRALFFAAYRDLLGTSTLELEVAEGATVADLVSALRDRGEPWNHLPEEPAVAVNRTYTALSASLARGDEVAFIPPVAGG